MYFYQTLLFLLCTHSILEELLVGELFSATFCSRSFSKLLIFQKFITNAVLSLTSTRARAISDNIKGVNYTNGCSRLEFLILSILSICDGHMLLYIFIIKYVEFSGGIFFY